MSHKRAKTQAEKRERISYMRERERERECHMPRREKRQRSLFLPTACHHCPSTSPRPLSACPALPVACPAQFQRRGRKAHAQENFSFSMFRDMREREKRNSPCLGQLGTANNKAQACRGLGYMLG